MPCVTNFIEDAAKVCNMQVAALFCEALGPVAAQGSKKVQRCKRCRTSAELPRSQTVLHTASTWIVRVISRWFDIKQSHS